MGWDLIKMETRLLRDLQRLKNRDGFLWPGLCLHLRHLVGRDSCISSWQLLHVDATIAQASLRALAKRQGKQFHALREEQPGKILHQTHTTLWDHVWSSTTNLFRWRFPYFGSIDSTELFLILLGRYTTVTGNDDLARELWPNAKSAVRWLCDLADVDGDALIEFSRANPHGLQHQGWKDGAAMRVAKIKEPITLVEAQGYTYAAFREIAHLARKIHGDEALAIELDQRAKNLQKVFIERFWLPDEQYFAFALDGDEQPIRIVTSNPGHLLFTGILDHDIAKRDAVVARLFSPDLWTPYGIRTHSAKDPLFVSNSYHRGSVWPHDNEIIHEGLFRCDYGEKARQLRHALFAAYDELKCTPELYGVDPQTKKLFRIWKACTTQAWTVGAYLRMIRHERSTPSSVK